MSEVERLNATTRAKLGRRSILVIDDHEATLTALRVLFRRQGWDVTTASCGVDGLELIASSAPDLALVDLNMDDLDGLAVLARVREAGPSAPPCLMMSAENSVPAAVEAMRLGARDFLVKPLDPRVIVERVHQALGSSASVDGRDPRAAWRDLHAPGIVGEDERLLNVFHLLERISPTDCTVLIHGESGTGKERVARALHAASPRHEEPFVPVNCAAIPETLIERELFGHSRGAFSGATRDREGRFAAADGGTLFLDEIGEMSPAAQAKLLRVLQDREFAPVGETRPRRVDVRIVTATKRDLGALAERGGFRADLFDRLNQIPLRLPSLRERADDIPQLARHFLDRAAARFGREASEFSPAAIAHLHDYPWPGNVRELENAIEQIVLHADGGVIGVADIPTPIAAAGLVGPATERTRTGVFELPEQGVDLRALLARIELELIEQALARTEGNRSQAARLLGLNRTTLVEKLRRTRC
ncbi:Transcriptional regulatory protein ZraR [Enhygromyxa salina]|uniref:Transcriptional regulatory protein ZraR n=1 Tax=Enhygromyxa salina TaxID=215803 RepID=A0A2S9XX42_9BACT|nr:sigma-54 dependent transcriptional regulator [Enhygromyxa salina]PRP97422.1 Transcriptional regulatory protein ZraR [Enhygromyxa salina]